MKLGLKEMKKEYKKVDIGKIEVSIYNGITTVCPDQVARILFQNLQSSYHKEVTVIFSSSLSKYCRSCLQW